MILDPKVRGGLVQGFSIRALRPQEDQRAFCGVFEHTSAHGFFSF